MWRGYHVFVVLSVLVVAAINVNPVTSARILAAIPAPFYSHHLFWRPFWRELARRGHHLTLLAPFSLNANVTNIREIVLHALPTGGETLALVPNYRPLFESLYDLMLPLADEHLGQDDVQALLNNRSEHFDIVLAEAFMPTHMAFAERFRCPLIVVASLDTHNWQHTIMGNPIHPLLYSMLTVIRDKPSFAHRLREFLIRLDELYLMEDYAPRFDAVIRKHFPGHYLPIREIEKKMELLFINRHPVVVPARPLSPAVINLGGGMHLLEEDYKDNLDGELQEFLDSSTDGVVYFSMGSLVRTQDIPPMMIQHVMQAFAGLKYNFLLKLDNYTGVAPASNMRIMRWVHQFPVLRHKNVKVFITQGGLHSLEETVLAAKPVIVIPFLADQYSNAIHMVERGIGVLLDYNTLSAEHVARAIRTIMENDTYRRSAEKYSRMMKDEPMTPLQKAVYWTEFVIRHKSAKHLHAKSLPTLQYYFIDVVAFLATVILVLVWMLVHCFRKLRKCFVNNSSVSSTSNGVERKEKVT